MNNEQQMERDLLYARTRIDEMEAMINGLMAYIAAMEIGVTPNINDENFNEILRRETSLTTQRRLERSGGEVGSYEQVAIARIGVFKDAFKSK